MKKLFKVKSFGFSLSILLVLILAFGFVGNVFASGHMNNADIVDTAVEADDFNTLVTALTEAGLVETLRGEGPFTVFAPTDEAFANLPDGALDNLLANPDQLSNVLLYHVLSGQVMAEDVLTLDGESVETASGDNINIRIEGDSVYINEAQVITTDIETSNGVIHVINSVLLP